MVGREDKKKNDLFFLCSLIEYIARKTLNKPQVIVNALGRKNLEKIYDLADVYHCDNIDDVSDDFISECNIQQGSFDNVNTCMYNVPTHWDIGKVYKRLVLSIAEEENTDVISALIRLHSNILVDKIENYNSDMYYQNNSILLDYYRGNNYGE